MKAPILGLAMATAAFAGSSLYFWKQLDSERERAAQVEETTRQLSERIVELEKAQMEFAQQRLASPEGHLTAELRRMSPLPDVEAAPQDGADAQNQVFTMRRTTPSPGMQKMMRTQARAHNKRLYAEAGKKLGLNKEETEKLLDLLTDHQMSSMDSPVQFTDSAAAEKHFADRQRAQETEISDLIGPDKAEALKDYQATIPARVEFEFLARQLAEQETPLTEAQSRKFLDAFLDERDRIPAPEFTAGMDYADYAKAANTWKDEYEKRVADQASRILDSKQLAAYTEIQQSQKEMRDQWAAAGITPPPPGVARRAMGVSNTFMYSTAAPAFVSGTMMSAPAAEAVPKEQKP
jgi:hypothetical protein